MATSRWRASSESGPSLLIPREKAKTSQLLMPDEESQIDEKPSGSSSGDETVVETDNSPDGDKDDNDKSLLRNTSIFTWKNLTYTVKNPSGDRTLLNNVQGWVKPGMLGALMGASGTCKTTLLDVLAQRKTDGTICGIVLVDGRELPVSFQRCAAYCEQLDVHEPYATVREALEFSALLRQSRDTPEKRSSSTSIRLSISWNYTTSPTLSSAALEPASLLSSEKESPSASNSLPNPVFSHFWMSQRRAWMGSRPSTRCAFCGSSPTLARPSSLPFTSPQPSSLPSLTLCSCWPVAGRWFTSATSAVVLPQLEIISPVMATRVPLTPTSANT